MKTVWFPFSMGVVCEELIEKLPKHMFACVVSDDEMKQKLC